jgi:acetoacetyl-CoA reductase/3-oxoacyl-[acyl-carrier protein] reductase
MATAAVSEVLVMESLPLAGMATPGLSVVSSPLSKPLAGKVALITGASRGIGRAIALELANRGATVAINFNTSWRRAEDVRCDIENIGGTCNLFQGDVSQKVAARKVIQDVFGFYNKVDILVNNAGITRDRTMRKMSDEDWNEVIDTNLNSVFYCTSAVLPAMMEQKYGRIVSMSSFVGQKGHFGQANYAASKAGLLGFTKSLALEMAKYNITANVIAPGFVATDMFNDIRPDRMEQIKDEIPMRRLAEPEEIAKAAAFLICDGDYVTGQQINVNGGIYM